MPNRQVVAKELADIFKVIAHPDRIRLIEELRDGEQDVNSLAAALDLPARSTPFRPVVKRLGSKFKASVADRPAPPPVLNEDQMAFLREQLDPAQEAALGYRYDTEPTPQDTPDREPARP